MSFMITILFGITINFTSFFETSCNFLLFFLSLFNNFISLVMACKTDSCVIHIQRFWTFIYRFGQAKQVIRFWFYCIIQYYFHCTSCDYKSFSYFIYWRFFFYSTFCTLYVRVFLYSKIYYAIFGRTWMPYTLPS